ncbi:MAG: hypothetical protein ACKO0Z_21535 [Betaproteobacteria bacterium]
MTIIRAPRIQRDFTILSNSLCLDNRLTMRALGVLVRLLCRPDNWRTNSEGLAEEFNCGRDAVRGALQELQQAGYIRMQKTQGANGQWSSAWLVFDEPQTDAGKTDAGKTVSITRTDETRTDETRTDEAKALRKRQAKPRVIISRDELLALGINDDDLDSWLTRRGSRSPVTKAVLADQQREADAAGLTLPQAIAYAAGKGWIAFNAGYYANARGAGLGGAQRRVAGPTEAERRAADRARAVEILGFNPYTKPGDVIDEVRE